MIFRGLAIPTYILFDADRSHKGTNEEEKSKRANRICLQLMGAAVEDFPDTQVNETWAVLEDDFEELVEKEFGQQEIARILGQVADELGTERGKKALKNVEVAARVVELAYVKGLRLRTFEDIVNAVTRLSAT